MATLTHDQADRLQVLALEVARTASIFGAYNEVFLMEPVKAGLQGVADAEAARDKALSNLNDAILQLAA